MKEITFSRSNYFEYGKEYEDDIDVTRLGVSLFCNIFSNKSCKRGPLVGSSTLVTNWTTSANGNGGYAHCVQMNVFILVPGFNFILNL